MRVRITMANVLMAVILGAGVAASDSPAPMKGGKASPEAATTTAMRAVPKLGKLETAKWSATTYEAAATEANKNVLAKGKPVSITGEVVDVSCYLQLGKRGEAHIACGTKCLMNGQPIGILDAKDQDNLYILFPEEHHPRRDGQVELKRVFVPWLAKQVTVSGMMTEMKGYRALFVQAAEIGGAMAPAPAPPDTGMKH